MNWVPRVSRSRKLLCGYQPTFAKKPEVQKQEVQKVAKAAPKPVAKKSVKRPLFGAPVNTVATLPATAAVRPKQEVATPPARVKKAAPKPEPKPKARKVASKPQAQTACPGASAVSRKYLRTNSGFAVRCGPQQDAVRTAKRSAQPAKSTARAKAYAAPVTQARAPVAPVRVPKGYRAAWEDDRLNPNRAKGTAQGRASMNQIWSQKPPRQQIAQVARTQQATQTYRSGGKYVQVGTFGVPSNAQRTAQRLSSMSLPVVSRKMTRGGRSYTVVSAGPFANSAALRAALQTARRAGFADAFIR